MRILAVSLISAVFVATVGLGWLFDHLFRQYQQNDAQAPLTAVTAMEHFGEDLRTMFSNGDYDFEQMQTLLANWPNAGHYQISLQSRQSLALPKDIETPLLAGEPLILASDQDISIYYFLDASQSYLVLTSTAINQQRGSTFKQYLFTSLFYLSLLLLMLLWLYPLITRLLALRSAAQQFGQGDLQQRVSVGSVSYIRDLEQEFNHMAQRISDLVADVKLLSSAVSHDLRTPLATIRFGIDTLQEESDPELRKKFEQRISKNVDEMIELVEILLNYARLDQNLISLDKSRLKVLPLLEQVVASRQTEAEVKLVNHAANDLVVEADGNYLSMLFKNLLQNALQHCQQQVVITVSELGDGIRVSVSDDGSGIAEEEREKILKPFVRGASSHKGYGIGLAIVQRVLHWHNGSMNVGNDEVLNGAKFTVSLPKAAGKRP